MAEKKEEFDVLTFFIYVMVLLTVLVSGMAAINYSQLSQVRRSVKSELGRLKQMETLALDEDFRSWITREREGAGTGKGSVADFQQLYVNGARRQRLVLETHTQEGTINHRGGIELPFRLVVKDCRVEELVTFLVGIEDDWPGARVKQIVKLDWDERAEAWDAVVVLSIYKSN